MKKILALVLAVAMVACMFVGCASTDDTGSTTTAPATTAGDTTPETTTPETTGEPVNSDASMKFAFVTDVGNIDDHSFNQYSYEGVTRFAEANGLESTYYKPAGDTDQDRIDAIQQAVNDGYGVVVMAGYLFGPAVYQVASANPDVLFLALDVTAGDLGADEVPSNIALVCYKEEQSGYLAGYAAVVEGYKELGFLGGMAVPAVVRFGYGFVQGAEQAAADLGVEGVNIKYWYSGSFVATDDIATKMDAWYVEGTEVVFACGGGIYQSCLNAADANDGLMIGVDVDQSSISDRIITSAEKALSNSVVLALTEAMNNGWAWPEAYAGTCQYLGAAEDCVGLPFANSKFSVLTEEQYNELYASLADGTLVVSDAIDVEPAVSNITVDYQ